MATETKASVRGVRLSADKGRLVADMIRGKKVDKALADLTFSKRRIAGEWLFMNTVKARDLTLASTHRMTADKGRKVFNL